MIKIEVTEIQEPKFTCKGRTIYLDVGVAQFPIAELTTDAARHLLPLLLFGPEAIALLQEQNEINKGDLDRLLTKIEEKIAEDLNARG